MTSMPICAIVFMCGQRYWAQATLERCATGGARTQERHVQAA